MNGIVAFFSSVFFIINVASSIRAEETTAQFGGNYAQIAETI